MKLTAKGRYAVMAVADMARASSERAGVSASASTVSLSAISERQGISLAYLEQIFAQLRRAGLVESVRGPSGGYSLSRAPKNIALSEIIAAINEDIRAHGCSPETRASCTGQDEKCLTHSLWGALEHHIGHFLAHVSVADVVAQNFPEFLPVNLTVNLPEPMPETVDAAQ